MSDQPCRDCGHGNPSSALYCERCGHPLHKEQKDPLIGQTIAERYHLVECIGQGSAGTVYRAEHVSLRRRIALKLLHPHLAKQDDAVERFRREAITVCEIDNEHIPQVFDFGRATDGRLFFAMEFLDGESLAMALGKAPEKRFSIDRTIDILGQLADALIEAHTLDYVHRDLRPRSVFLTKRRGRTDFVKLLDFGLAKLVRPDVAAMRTAMGMNYGEPRYMAPEQARGERVDRRADVYSLGAIAFEMLTGRPPYEGRSAMEIMGRLIESPVPRICEIRTDCPPWLESIVRVALAKVPSERFQTVNQIVEALEGKQIQSHQPPHGPATKVSVPAPAAAALAKAQPLRSASASDGPAQTQAMPTVVPSASSARKPLQPPTGSVAPPATQAYPAANFGRGTGPAVNQPISVPSRPLRAESHTPAAAKPMVIKPSTPARVDPTPRTAAARIEAESSGWVEAAQNFFDEVTNQEAQPAVLDSGSAATEQAISALLGGAPSGQSPAVEENDTIVSTRGALGVARPTPSTVPEEATGSDTIVSTRGVLGVAPPGQAANADVGENDTMLSTTGALGKKSEGGPALAGKTNSRTSPVPALANSSVSGTAAGAIAAGSKPLLGLAKPQREALVQPGPSKLEKRELPRTETPPASLHEQRTLERPKVADADPAQEDAATARHVRLSMPHGDETPLPPALMTPPSGEPSLPTGSQVAQIGQVTAPIERTAEGEESQRTPESGPPAAMPPPERDDGASWFAAPPTAGDDEDQGLTTKKKVPIWAYPAIGFGMLALVIVGLSMRGGSSRISPQDKPTGVVTTSPTAETPASNTLPTAPPPPPVVIEPLAPTPTVPAKPEAAPQPATPPESPAVVAENPAPKAATQDKPPAAETPPPEVKPAPVEAAPAKGPIASGKGKGGKAAAALAAKAAAKPVAPTQPVVAKAPVEKAPVDAKPVGAAKNTQVAELVSLAKRKLEDGDPDAATDGFSRAVALDPKNTEALFGLGAAAFEKGDFDTAIRHLTKAARLSPKRASYLLLLADSQLKARRYGDAIATCKRVLAADPGSTKAKQILERAESLGP